MREHAGIIAHFNCMQFKKKCMQLKKTITNTPGIEIAKNLQLK